MSTGCHAKNIDGWELGPSSISDALDIWEKRNVGLLVSFSTTSFGGGSGKSGSSLSLTLPLLAHTDAWFDS